jgi:processive 1,2-diacylglycerol beta-glucosyltransferase
MTNPKILIFYASYGDGHIQVSNALMNSFLDNGINDVKMIDLLAEAQPFLDALSRFFYLKSTTYFPQVYGLSYYLTYNMRHDQFLAKWLNSLCVRQLKKIIEQEKPDAIINTFPMLSIFELRDQMGITLPTFTVITDYVLHSRWIHPETDRYFVATEDLKNQMIMKGIGNHQISVSGIPVRKVFQETFDLNAIKQRNHLNPELKIVLIMASAYGVVSILKQMIRLLLTIEGIQILIVCGRNTALRNKLEAMCSREPKVMIMGFVDQIQELMAISSCIITKAGGITLTEAITLQLPIIVFRPASGQEKENAAYLAEKKLISIVRQVSELKKTVQQLLTANGKVNQVKDAKGSSIDKQDAAEVVVSEVLREVERRNTHRQLKEIPQWVKKERQQSYET